MLFRSWELCERILREIETFVGAAAQHDDMTMILLKVNELASAAGLSGVTVDRDISLASARSGA